ncbi:class I SAM-dependent methyltransferase [Belliella kenyensis]|uniref:Class I SAM-dependent methyltransferase n=1 Tax=Belliella kenyensis TaxID=1472724 RepID=A0ABV8ELJ2_9BACT|nr:class I SAM-dependent methyltransferase [Belliella kenyensis]MCH7401232.1 class I SAM-dependent methyltransferase [Belliella kenyensis]MDN3602678.1 class I SAM-dependent methyltransferase [Belliella kenyensis]
MDAKKEKAHYEHHHNGPEHPGYLQYLSKIIEPVTAFLFPQSTALDYGCGPGPALDFLLKDYGVTCDNYDPFFFKDGIARKSYDFIFATECFEHFHHPEKEVRKMLDLLKIGGLLCIMTVFHQGIDTMEKWYYAKDLTHVAFYSHQTMKWISHHYHIDILYQDQKSICVFQKN